MNAMFDHELLDINNITSEVILHFHFSLLFFYSKRKRWLWFHNLQFRMLIKLLRSLRISRVYING